MKNFLIFIAGVITGVVLLIMVGLLFMDKSNGDNITLLSEPGECISSNSFEIIQVLDNGNALAREDETFLIVLFLAEKGISYYDDQIIEIPDGKCAKQIGIFRYTTRLDQLEKTVPVVKICDK